MHANALTTLDALRECSPFSCRPSRKDLPGTRDCTGLSRGHRTRALSRLSVQELSSVCIFACHKFDEKSLIAAQTQQRRSLGISHCHSSTRDTLVRMREEMGFQQTTHLHQTGGQRVRRSWLCKREQTSRHRLAPRSLLSSWSGFPGKAVPYSVGKMLVVSACAQALLQAIGCLSLPSSRRTWCPR